MTNVVAMISEAVMTRLARWLRVGILVGYMALVQRGPATGKYHGGPQFAPAA